MGLISRVSSRTYRFSVGFFIVCNVLQILSKMASGNAKIGAAAPDFKTTAVVDGGFVDNFSMSRFKGKYVVLFFYPLYFTFVCPTEICAFSDRANEFKELGCEVLACSTDSHFSPLAWTQQSRKQGGIGEMNIPLLADTNHDIGKKIRSHDPGRRYLLPRTFHHRQGAQPSTNHHQRFTGRTIC